MIKELSNIFEKEGILKDAFHITKSIPTGAQKVTFNYHINFIENVVITSELLHNLTAFEEKNKSYVYTKEAKDFTFKFNGDKKVEYATFSRMTPEKANNFVYINSQSNTPNTIFYPVCKTVHIEDIMNRKIKIEPAYQYSINEYFSNMIVSCYAGIDPDSVFPRKLKSFTLNSQLFSSFEFYFDSVEKISLSKIDVQFLRVGKDLKELTIKNGGLNEKVDIPELEKLSLFKTKIKDKINFTVNTTIETDLDDIHQLIFKGAVKEFKIFPYTQNNIDSLKTLCNHTPVIEKLSLFVNPLKKLLVPDDIIKLLQQTDPTNIQFNDQFVECKKYVIPAPASLFKRKII